MREPPESSGANVMRHAYRTLSNEEQMYVNEIKNLGEEMVSVFEKIAQMRGVRGPYQLDCARERVEEAVFWAVKFISG